MLLRNTQRSFSAVIVLLAWIAAGQAGAASRSITVSAPDCDYRDYPITVTVSAPDAARGAVLTHAAGQNIPCTFWRDGGNVMLTWIIAELKKGATIAYKVEFVDKPVFFTRGVGLDQKADGVDVMINGGLFTRYIITGASKPYCYPVLAADGTPVTRNYPMGENEYEKKMKDLDHPHQRSLWFTHGNVNDVDFWLEFSGREFDLKPSDKAGKCVHRTFEALESGAAMGRLRAVTDWIGPDKKKICEDTRELRFYNVANGRMLDWDITIKAPDAPVKFGDTKEGMFGLRTATSMKVDAKKLDPKAGGRIINAEGLTDAKAWGMSSPWVDYCGPIGSKTYGIAVFDHPSSFRHPTYWHVRTYGLFAANPFGLHDFPNGKGKDGSHTIEKGGSITFRYRLFIHEGTTEEAGIAQVWQQFAKPPQVKVE